jgi:hypothetical protein
MNREVGFSTVASVGTMEEVNVAGDCGVGWGKHLRFQISVDLTKPLESKDPQFETCLCR